MYLLLCHIPVTIIKTTYLLGHFQSLPKYPFHAATAATIPVDISETKRSIGDLLVSLEALRFKVFNTHSCVHKDIKVSQKTFANLTPQIVLISCPGQNMAQ